MIHPSEISAVLVTRGDVDMSAIHESLAAAGIDDVVTWDNSQRDRDLICYGRYEAVAEAKNEWIYHQDDDLLVPVADLLARVDPERDRWTVVANNRPDEGWPLTGIGSVFHRDLAGCFDDYIAAHGFDGDFCRICDVVFSHINSYRHIWVGYEDLPWHSSPNSMYLQEGIQPARERARLRTLELPVKVAA